MSEGTLEEDGHSGITEDEAEGSQHQEEDEYDVLSRASLKVRAYAHYLISLSSLSHG